MTDQHVSQATSEQPVRVFRVDGMHCGSCAQTVADSVARLGGVTSAEVDFATERLRVAGGADEGAIRACVAGLGYRLEAPGGAPPAARMPGGVSGFARYVATQPETRPALAGAALLAVALATRIAAGGGWTVDALVLAALAVAGYPVARAGLGALAAGRAVTIQLLMTLAAAGAVVIGELWEGATVMVLFAVAEALESFTVDRARDSLRALVALAPTRAVRLRAGREETVDAAEVAPGDTVLVRPGERIPVDGVVRSGAGDVNQAPITGESLPVHRAPGDAVFAGTVNGSAALEVEATRPASDSTLARVIHLVEEAQSARAPTQRFIDRFARWYTPAVVALAVVVAAVPPLAFGAPFFDTAAGHGWLYRGLVLLVVACPCALVISTPVTMISAISAAARNGVLFKGGASLERLGTVRAVAFDKTGTLTRGEPVVASVQAVDCDADDGCVRCDDVLALAAALERRSAHPVARAVVTAAESRALADRYAPAEDVTALVGRGLQGTVGGKLATLGSHALFEADHPHAEDVCRWIDAAEARGQTAMLLCDGDRVRGVLAVADAVHPDSPAAVVALHDLGLSTVMLTGDNAATAREVASTVGVDDVLSGLLPADKVEAVRALAGRHGAVAMVGDGINDAPALAAADVGIAVGGAASAQALEAAEVVLLADGIRRLPYAVRLARFTRRVLAFGIGISLGTKVVFVVLTLFGWTSLWLAIAADMGVSLAVVVNGMRPLRVRG